MAVSMTWFDRTSNKVVELWKTRQGIYEFIKLESISLMTILCVHEI